MRQDILSSFYGVLLLLILTVLPGCMTKTVPLATLEKNNEAQEYALSPGNSSNVFVVFTGGYSSSFGNFPVQVDGVHKGMLSVGTFVMVPLKPGNHSVTSSTPENYEVVEFEVKEGKNNFVDMSSKIGMHMLRVSLSELPENEGKVEVSKAKLIHRTKVETTSISDEIIKLDELRKKGLLSDSEFETQKSRILNK
jgi:hypothetical protein